MIGVKADQLSKWPDVDKSDLVLPSPRQMGSEVVINKELASCWGGGRGYS